MAGKNTSNRSQKESRFVRCPKCAKILPEPEQVPVYACGGCDTILQAKYYRNDRNGRGSSLDKTADAQINGVAHARDGGESDGSSQRPSSSGEQSLDQNEERDQNAEVNCESEMMKTANFSQCTSLSEASPPLREKENGERDQSAIVNCNVEEIDLTSLSAEPSVVSNKEKEERDKEFDERDSANNASLTETSAHEIQGLEETESERDDNVNRANEDKDDKLEHSTEISFDNEEQIEQANSPREPQSKEPSTLASEGQPQKVKYEKEENGLVECLSEKLEGVKLDEAPSPTETARVGDRSKTVRINDSGSDNVPDSTAKDSMFTGEVTLAIASESTRHQISSLDIVMETSNKKIENLESIEPVDTMGNSKKVAARSSTKESFTDEESLSESQDKSPSSMLADEKLNKSILEDDESPEENPPPFRTRTGPKRHGHPPRVPLYYRNPEMAYETGSSSSYAYAHDELPGHHMAHHPYRYEKPESWLEKTYTNRGNLGRRRRFSEAGWSKDELLPEYYGYETSGEIYRRPGYYHSCTDRRRRSESWAQSGGLPQFPFSGGGFHGRYQIADPYMTRPHIPDPYVTRMGACCHQGLCMAMAPSRDLSWDPYESYTASPHHAMDLESTPWANDVIFLSDDRRYKDQIMRRLFLREKRQAVKRHLQPVAGGAPFITCYFCFRVLRLPEDFLQPRRRRKQTRLLKCGACLKILEFSLENECSFIACRPKASEDAQTDVRHNYLPSEEAKPGNDTIGGSEREKSKPVSMDEETGDNNGGEPSDQRTQMKVSWQLPAQTKSPLHQLMGYSSPRDLLTGYLEDIE